MKQILDGKASRAAAAMRSHAAQAIPREASRGVDKCPDYLLKYAAYMDYASYLAAGLPIASGVVEGACR